MIETVTITGADDYTSIDEMIYLSKHYPFVEWGILVMDDCTRPRFPSKQWIAELPEKLKLSVHLCGQYVHDILEGNLKGENIFWNEKGQIDNKFKRVQINTHGILHNYDAQAAAMLIDSYPAKHFIFQYDEVNKQALLDIYSKVKRKFAIEALFDLSHGAGVLPSKWPNPFLNIKFGYAGGLGPDNLSDQIPKIIEASKGSEGDIWIDMETHVRTDEKLDLQKVVKCLETAKPFTHYKNWKY